MIEIIPAVIPQDLNVVREKFERVLGLAKKVQIDFLDGQYAETVTWPFGKNQGDELLKIVREEEKFPFVDDFILEADMLILHPIEQLSDLLSIGFKSFVIHIDSTDHVKECIETIKRSGCKVGIGIKPSVDTIMLKPYLLDIDFVQFMGNDKVGHAGISLDLNVLPKIKKFHSEYPDIQIQTDIGVDFETAPLLIEAGATSLVSGSTLFNSPNIKEALNKLRAL